MPKYSLKNVNKSFPLAFVLCFYLSTHVFADALLLSDGRRIEGKLIEQDELQVIIRDERGRLNRFYKDQVAQVIIDDVKAPPRAEAALYENIDQEKVGLILRLLEANGLRKNLQTNIDTTLNKAPADQREELKKLFNISDIVTELVPVYDRYFTSEELVAMIEFYESPAGQKMIGTSSDLIKEVTQTSLGYFQKKLLAK